MIDIIPSVLTNNIDEAASLIRRCDGVSARVQIDIIDGVFANNKTIDPADLQSLEVSFGYDFHLMVKEPVNWVEKCVNAGADRIVGQIEMMSSQKDFVETVQFKNLRVGLALDLHTSVSRIDPALFNLIDVVLVMSVAAGFGGQKFEKSSLIKIAELNDIRVNKKVPFHICVDGGETEDVIDDSVYAGADEVVFGRRLFKGDLASNIKRMREAARG